MNENTREIKKLVDLKKTNLRITTSELDDEEAIDIILSNNVVEHIIHSLKGKTNNRVRELETQWRHVKTKLPKESGWYLVYAPNYQSGSSVGLQNIDGIMFSRFSVQSNKWSVEMKKYNNGCVRAWLPLPLIPERLSATNGD